MQHSMHSVPHGNRQCAAVAPAPAACPAPPPQREQSTPHFPHMRTHFHAQRCTHLPQLKAQELEVGEAVQLWVGLVLGVGDGGRLPGALVVRVLHLWRCLGKGWVRVGQGLGAWCSGGWRSTARRVGRVWGN